MGVAMLGVSWTWVLGTLLCARLPPSATPLLPPTPAGSIGVIKMDKKKGVPKIWLYKDKSTGVFKGDGTVSYGALASAAHAHARSSTGPQAHSPAAVWCCVAM